MSNLTNEALDQMWEVAAKTGDKKVLRLIEEIDSLKSSNAAVTRRYTVNKKVWKQTLERSRRKSFHRGQGYIRSKIAATLAGAGMTDASVLALSTHLDYNVDPVGNYIGP